MEKNKKIIKLCYLQIAFYVVFLTSLLLHFKRGLDHRAFALLIILTLLGCASALTLTDYLKSLIRRSGFDVAGVHDKKSLEEKLLQLQNADDTLDVGVMMFDMNNLKMINDTYGHEEGDVFIQTFASYLTRILTEDSFLARFGGDEFVIVQNHATWNQLEQMNLQLQTMIDTYNQTAFGFNRCRQGLHHPERHCFILLLLLLKLLLLPFRFHMLDSTNRPNGIHEQQKDHSGADKKP